MASATFSYDEIISAVRTACAATNVLFSGSGDGRIESATKESAYLEKLKENLVSNGHTVSIPPDRYWYDVRIDGIPFNLKLTTAVSSDNAFNKVSIIYTLCGLESTKKNMNFNEWWSAIKTLGRKTARARMTEYHFIVVDKRTGKFLVRSLVDIHTYTKNPCNILQINWKNEFDHPDHDVGDDFAAYTAKINSLLKTVRDSLVQRRESEDVFLTESAAALA